MKEKSNILFEKIVVLISLISSIILAFCGLFIPPAGTIDASVLIMEAQILLFIGGVMGIRITAMNALEKAVLQMKEKK